MYNILEARIEYKGGKLHRVTVLVEISQGDVRAIFSTVGPRQGYDYLNPDEPINDALLQRVAGYGITSGNRDAIFPNWKAKQTVAVPLNPFPLPFKLYHEWRAELIQVTARATGQSEAVIKINDIEAEKWYRNGFTAYQCFRETYDMENDSYL